MYRDNFRKYWSWVIIYTLFIFFLSSLSGGLFPAVVCFPFIDKIFHIFLYSGLGFLSLRAIVKKSPPLASYFLFSLAYCLFIGVLDEFWQGFTPQRQPDLLDLASDLLGANIGGAVYLKFLKP